jgi:hypothetical protein
MTAEAIHFSTSFLYSLGSEMGRFMASVEEARVVGEI